MRTNAFRLVRMTRFVLVALCAFFLAGCELVGIEGKNSSNLDSPIKGYNEQFNVSYGREENMNLDLHLPVANDSLEAEVVILLHGGGWVSGDKSFLKPTVDILKSQRKNLAIVNINYRLASPNNTLLSLQLSDLESVINFLNLNAEKYNIRNDRYRLAGLSAGGHIALTYAYKTVDPSVNTLIALSAPTELSVRAWLGKTLWSKIELLTGNAYGGPIDIFKNESPFYLATARSPRTILVYGEQDDLVSPRQGELLADKLRLLRVPYSYHLLLGETHEISATSAAKYIMEAYD